MDTTTGAPLGAPGIRLVDADAHVNEPPDLWTSRVPVAIRDRVPQVKRFEEGDAWTAPGASIPLPFGLTTAAGLAPEQRRSYVRFEDVPPAGYDPKARLAAMDQDLVDATVLYPTPRLHQVVVAERDPELHLALVRAYNDWLAEFCATDPGRLGGIALVPNRGVAAAVDELERVISLPGMVGGLIGCYPHGDLNLASEDDPVWRTLAEARWPLHIHVALVDTFPSVVYRPDKMTEGGVSGDLRFLQAPVRMLQFLAAGVFSRFSNLDLVLAEVDAGWVPYVKEQVDNRLLRRGIGAEIRTSELPSQVIERHVHFTYITDHFAIANRHAVGVDRLMWSSDFPHSGSDWPTSVRVIHGDFATVPALERDLILAGNARRLYGFPE